MKRPTHPVDTQRTATLDAYDILDTPQEAEFDEITRLASHICQTPIAMVSLVTADRQWFKSRIGVDCCETSLDVSICAQAILEPDIFVVPDTMADPRFADISLVCDEHCVRFYAGAQLRSPDGYALGTLCVLDTRPRELDDAQLSALRMLAAQTMHLIELRRMLNRQAELTNRLQERIEALHSTHRMVSHDLRSPLTTAHLAAQHLSIDPDRETTRKLAEHVMSATKKMTALVNDLSAQTPESVVSSDSFSPEQLLDEVVAFFEVPARNARIELTSQTLGSLPHVKCDPQRTFQIFNNLIDSLLIRQCNIIIEIIPLFFAQLKNRD